MHHLISIISQSKLDTLNVNQSHKDIITRSHSQLGTSTNVIKHFLKCMGQNYFASSSHIAYCK